MLHSHTTEHLRLQRLVEGSGNGYWEWHVPTGEFWHDPRCAEMLGYSQEDVTATAAWAHGLIHPSDSGAVNQMFTDYLDGQASEFEMTYRVRMASGNWKWVLSRAFASPAVSPPDPQWVGGSLIDLDVRRRSEAKLTRPLTRQALLLSKLPLGMMETNLQGLVTSLNPAAERILGYTASQAVGLHASTFLQDVSVSTVSDDELLIVRARTREARIITCEWLYQPLVEEDEAIGGLVYFRDVTEAHRAEAELRKLWSAMSQSPLSVMLVGAAGTVDYVNPRFEEMSGYCTAETLGREFLSVFLIGDDRLHLGQSIWDTVLSGHVWKGEVCRRRKSGEVYWEWAVMSPVRDAEGSVIGMVGFEDDRSAEKRMERELASSVAKFKGIFETMEDGYLEAELDGETTMVNPAAVGLLGYDEAAELRAVPPLELFADEEDRARFRLALDEVGRVSSNRARLRLRDGSVRVFEVNLRLVPHPEGKRSSVVLMFRDITDRLRADEEAQARLSADAANRLKGEFLANMSHEIRTPMHAVLGLTHLALQTELTERQRDYLSNIQDSGRALLHIVNDILDFSKVEAGKLELEQVEFQLDEVLETLVSTTADKIDRSGLSLRVVVSPAISFHLRGDPMHLGQVLLNLVSNAIKFTTFGEVVVKVDLDSLTDQQAKLRFEVSDTGTGMTEEVITRLFQAFSQADSSITRKFGGTGLGLAICRRLVHLMQGEIEASSLPGQGSTFTFTAIFGTVDVATSLIIPKLRGRREPVRSESLKTALEKVRGAHVLVVEDNRINQQIARELLEQAGILVDLASNGQEAVERVLSCHSLAVCPWDLVLMDLQMPKMDGYSATAAIRCDSRFNKLPILAMTAHVLVEERDRCRQAGMDDYVTKPIDSEALFTTLCRWLPARANKFPSIAGIDTADGLMRVAGNQTLYRSLLLQMAGETPTTSSDLQSASASGNLVRVRALAHALRGVAGNLGMRRLEELGTELELGASRAEVDAVEQELREVSRAILSEFAELPKVLSAPLASASDRIANLERLGELMIKGVLTQAEFELEKSRVLAS